MQNDVVQRLLEPSQLTLEQVQAVLHDTGAHQLDFVDYYFQHAVNETWVLEDGIVKNGNYNVERGLGVRAIIGEKTGFAYSDEVSLDAITTASNAAKAINPGTHSKAQNAVQDLSCVDVAPLYAAVNPIAATSDPEKIELLRTIDKYVRTQLPQVSQLVVSLSAVYEEILIMASDGTLATDIRPLIRLNCSLLLEDGSRRERGSAGCGGRYAFSEFFAEDTAGQPRWMRLADQAIHMAKVNLRAVAAPAGTFPVVLGAGWPGVLLHEAVGHGLEGDFNRKKSSTFSGRMGQLVASELCTIVDDGTLPNRRGSLTIDDEGTPSARNVLIENGVLTGYLQDKHNAKLMGHKATGNGRRESYAHLPMPRMTNTFMLGGSSSPEEIIASVESGIYAPNFGGGQVDITSGKFVFSTSEAYMIEKGKVTHPVKGATLIGNGPEAMQRVSMVGNDLCLDDGIGVCGKDGQSVPVGVGQPTLKVDQLTVGGTQ